MAKEKSLETDYRRTRGETVEIDGEELFDHYTLVATNGQTAMRVDKFLSNLLPGVTRSRIQNASKTGSIAVNGVPVKVSYKVKGGDTIKLLLPYPPPPELDAEDIPIDVRYEDDDLMIVYKAADMVVHPGVGNHTGTLVNALLWHVQHSSPLPLGKGIEGEQRPGLVHRLDKNTTGIMVVAKHEQALAHLSKQFFDRTTDRRYWAVVWGDVKEDEGTITGNTGRSLKNRKIFRVFPEGDYGKHAVTHFKVLERFGIATLVELKLETGRTHQIRVHMKYHGHTLFGDGEYGGDKVLSGLLTKKYQQFINNCLLLMPAQALHAKTLSFDHPRTGKRMVFDSEPPPNFLALMEKLRKWATVFGE